MTQDFDARATTWDDDPVKAARAAEVARQIRERVQMDSRSEVLDFGSGTGLLGFHFLPFVASVTFADPSEGMLAQVGVKLREGGHHNGRTLHLDPDAIALPQRYGAIVSLMTLHHVATPSAVVRLLAEALEPGGWLALCDLETEDGTFHDDRDADVHHGFDPDALVTLVEGFGLERARASSAWVMRLERPEGVREYPLFLLTARRPPAASGPRE